MHASSPLVRLSAESTLPRLLCLPFAGGGSHFYRTWTAIAAGRYEIWSADLPGRLRRGREPMVTDLHAVCDELADATSDLLDRPIVLFGHSMGALLGYELVRRLAVRGPTLPRAMVVSACPAPHVRDLEPLSGLRDDELLTKVGDWGGTTNAVLNDREMATLLLSCLRADLVACETYAAPAPGPALDLPLAALVAEDDDMATRSQAEQWRTYTTQWRGTRCFPGGHFYLGTARDEVFQAIVETEEADSLPTCRPG